ncbi:hypothetical protein PVAP13_8NG318968 [Panicum virgatum]|uniref:Uncharacterized protein n=1 Tax=Panicum virgatum TaxID=38727 RepID=A0A8T0PLK8_PANVG|nr:hypothetical protein PVAP13_8NG318968 [Panicum virgatum]
MPRRSNHYATPPHLLLRRTPFLAPLDRSGGWVAEHGNGGVGNARRQVRRASPSSAPSAGECDCGGPSNIRRVVIDVTISSTEEATVREPICVRPHEEAEQVNAH